MIRRLQILTKWLTVGMGIKRWLLLMLVGVFLIAIGFSHLLVSSQLLVDLLWFETLLFMGVGLGITLFALRRLAKRLLEPYRRHQQGPVVDMVNAHRKRDKGIRVVAIGGGTGLPSVLRGFKPHTSNITAVVTVADDGGSSGRLRREHGILPPGDLRNNIAALADDENLMTRLFQHRFDSGDLGGHAFGNLFITALASVTGSIETALIETERVLNIQGRVLPSSLADVNLVASVEVDNEVKTIKGESQISNAGGHILKIKLNPPDVLAYKESVAAIRDADLVVIGPGSLYTSLIPNLLVKGIAEALRSTNAYRVYVCNVATQPGETVDYDVAEHLAAIEAHVGPGIVDAVLANDSYPSLNAGINTHYVRATPATDRVFRHYKIEYTDLTDVERPWRHDPQKLVTALSNLVKQSAVRDLMAKPAFTTAHKPVIIEQLDPIQKE